MLVARSAKRLNQKLCCGSPPSIPILAPNASPDFDEGLTGEQARCGFFFQVRIRKLRPKAAGHGFRALFMRSNSKIFPTCALRPPSAAIL